MDGCLGEYSQFHTTFKIYAHGNDSSTPLFADGWEERALHENVEGCEILIPSLEDLAIAKYISGREKDLEYVKTMWKNDMLDSEKMEYLFTWLPLNRIGGENCERIIAKIEADRDRYKPKASTLHRLG